jgi:hypothetical protein
MTLLAGAASFLVGNAYQPLMPGFARDLGATEATFFYSALLTASAAGALCAGVVLEMRSASSLNTARSLATRESNLLTFSSNNILSHKLTGFSSLSINANSLFENSEPYVLCL